MTEINTDTLKTKLASTSLPAERPDLVSIYDAGASVIVRHTDPEYWQEWEPAAVVAGFSYTEPYQPGLAAVGIWLPSFQLLYLVESDMQDLELYLNPGHGRIPEPDRVTIVRELRGLMGSAIMRPGRLSAEPPIIVAERDPALSTPALHAATRYGHQIIACTPAEAAARWETASQIFIHANSIRACLDLPVEPRADISVLAAARTPAINKLARALHTDEILEWPRSADYLGQAIARRAEAAAEARRQS